MALRAIESFDGLGDAQFESPFQQLQERGWLEVVGAFITILKTEANPEVRTGGAAIKIGAGDHLRWYSSGVEDEFFFCFSWMTENQGIASPYEICRIEYNDGSTFNRQLTFMINTARGVSVYRGQFDTGTLIASDLTATVVLGQLNDFQLRVKIHPTLGELDVKVNNTFVISDTGLNTRNHASANIVNQIGFFRAPDTGGQGDGSRVLEDFYAMDTVDAGDGLNDFLGVEARVYPFYADRDIVTGWTAQGAGDTYVEVDDANLSTELSDADDDTTYIHSAVNGARAIVGVTNPNEDEITEVFAVEVNARWRLEQGGSDQIKLISELSSAVQLSAALSGSTTWNNENELFTADPNGNPWTPANVIAMGIGVEEVA